MSATLLSLLFATVASAAPKHDLSGVRPAARPGMRLAGQALHLGSYRTAIKLYEKQVAASPDAPAPNVALGRAYAKAGNCARALDQLEAWVGTEPFGESAALSASTCAARLGLMEEAIYYDRVAVTVKPTSVRAWTTYALDLDALGDTVSRDEVLELLAGRVGDRSEYAQAVLAARHGDTEAFDFIVLARERRHESVTDYAMFDARLWLDLGDPQACLDRMQGHRNRSQLRPLRAEALRRLSDPTQALQVIDAHIRGTAQGELADAVRSRIHDDLGEADAAAELLDAWPDADDADLVASAWYHARAVHDEAGMNAAAARYAVLQDNPHRTLEGLLPLGVPAR